MLNPTYLHRNSYGIYHFRIAVPKHLRYVIGSREIKRSLRTLNFVDAIQKARRLSLIALDLFQQPEITKAMFSSKLKIVTHTTSDGSVTEEITLDPNHLEAEKELLKCYREHSQKIETSPTHNRITFSQVVKEYLDDMDTQEKWEPKTRQENIDIFDTFTEAMSDLDMVDINTKIANEYLDILKKLPSNRNKKCAYKNKNIQQLIASNIPESDILSTSTINKYLRRIKQILTYAVNAGYLSVNPFSNVSLKNRDKSKPRLSFTTDEVAALFDPAKLTININQPNKFWIPIIAAFTGARLEEIAQLTPTDIRTIDDVPCICFSEDSESKTTKSFKTQSSLRTIPVHSELIRLNFLKFCNDQKTRKYVQLFPELKADLFGKRGSNYSKYFTRYRRSCGVTAKGKTFHSFRHTVATQLKRANQDPTKSAVMIGHHTNDNFTFEYYGDSFLPKQLIDVVETITYKDIFEKVTSWK